MEVWVGENWKMYPNTNENGKEVLGDFGSQLFLSRQSEQTRVSDSLIETTQIQFVREMFVGLPRNYSVR